jgi:hypothetical protein
MVRSVAGFKKDPSVFVVGASHVKVTAPPPVTVSVAVPTTLPNVALIDVDPMATDVARPLEPPALLMVATPAVNEFQFTDVVRFCVVPSEYVPVAVNCWAVPRAMLGLAGVIAMDTSVAAVTVSVVDPDMLPSVAVIVVEPGVSDVARPLEPPALLMVATPAVNEFQVTDVVRFCVVPSEYVPVAVNCRVVPSTMLGFAGVIAMDTSVAAVTVSVVDPDVPPNVAVIVVVPADADVARPLEPDALLTVATPAVNEFQVTVVVRFCVVPSE